MAADQRIPIALEQLTRQRVHVDEFEILGQQVERVTHVLQRRHQPSGKRLAAITRVHEVGNVLQRALCADDPALAVVLGLAYGADPFATAAAFGMDLQDVLPAFTGSEAVLDGGTNARAILLAVQLERLLERGRRLDGYLVYGGGFRGPDDVVAVKPYPPRTDARHAAGLCKQAIGAGELPAHAGFAADVLKQPDEVGAVRCVDQLTDAVHVDDPPVVWATETVSRFIMTDVRAFDGRQVTFGAFAVVFVDELQVVVRRHRRALRIGADDVRKVRRECRDVRAHGQSPGREPEQPLHRFEVGDLGTQAQVVGLQPPRTQQRLEDRPRGRRRRHRAFCERLIVDGVFEQRCDVLCLVEDAADRSVVLDQRCVHHAPVTLFEPATFGFGARYRIALHGHRVGRAMLQDAFQGIAQVPGAVRIPVSGVVREGVEYRSADEVLATPRCGGEIRVADRNDLEVVRRQHEQPGGDVLEQDPEALRRAAQGVGAGPGVVAGVIHGGMVM